MKGEMITIRRNGIKGKTIKFIHLQHQTLLASGFAVEGVTHIETVTTGNLRGTWRPATPRQLTLF
jgi:hypothetical protein